MTVGGATMWSTIHGRFAFPDVGDVVGGENAETKFFLHENVDPFTWQLFAPLPRRQQLCVCFRCQKTGIT